jgi:hypothetical protein
MAKGRSRKSAKADKKAATAPKALPSRAPVDAPKAKRAGKLKPGVRKQLRRLERQLADAARQERNRVRKLERARHRRQLIEATLDGLRGVAPARPAPPAAADPIAAAAPTAAAPAAAVQAKAPARPRAARARAPRPAASARRTAPKPPTA